MYKIKILFLSIFLSISLSSCISTILLAGSVASTTLTVQEVDEEYDGDVLDYIQDKSNDLYRYLFE